MNEGSGMHVVLSPDRPAATLRVVPSTLDDRRAIYDILLYWYFQPQ
jgi:hypothetical protein